MELACERSIREKREFSQIVKDYAEAHATGKTMKLKVPPSCPPVPRVKKPPPSNVRLIDQKNRKQPPVVITKQRFDKIIANATNAAEAQAAADRLKEEHYRIYLKEGSDEITAKFGPGFLLNQEQRLAKMRLADEEKNKEAEEVFKELSVLAAKERYEKIQKAQEILDNMKAGPKELRNAAMHSEIVHARNRQIAIREHYAKAGDKQDELDREKCDLPADKSLEEDIKREMTRKKNMNCYKAELKKQIDENQRRMFDKRRQELKEAVAERVALDQAVKKEIEKEKAGMRRKLELNRKNALEAMKMVEQRRLREAMTNKIEDRVNCVFNAGQNQLKQLLKAQEKELEDSKKRKQEQSVKKMLSMQLEDPRIKEGERLKRDISFARLKFTAEEEAKKEKIRAAKQARIEEYLREVQAKKRAEALAEEKRRYEMAERFKNTEVNRLFEKQVKEDKIKKIKALTKDLEYQLVQRQEYDRIRKGQNNIDCLTELSYIKDDRRFYEYAAQLMEDARKKGRPLYPFIRVVQQYRRETNVDKKVPIIPSHLVSNVPINKAPASSRKIGDFPTQGMLAFEAVQKAKVPVCVDERKVLEDSIATNLARIEKCIADEAAERDKPCPSYCPIECNRHNEMNMSPTSSERLRYSVWELKKLNQYEEAGKCVNQLHTLKTD